MPDVTVLGPFGEEINYYDVESISLNNINDEGVSTFISETLVQNQIQADWAQTDESSVDYIKNKPEERLLPEVNSDNEGQFLGVLNGTWEATDLPEVKELPEVSEDEEGKVLGVKDGEWAAIDAPVSLPEVSAEEEGKVLGVEEGVWTPIDVSVDLSSYATQEYVDNAIANIEVEGDYYIETDIFPLTLVEGFLENEAFNGAYSSSFVSPAQFQLEENQTYWVEWEKETFESVAKKTEDIIYLGSGAPLGAQEADYPFCIIYNVTADYTQFIGLIEGSSHTIRIYTREKTMQIPSDWNQDNQNAPDFIKNKPFELSTKDFVSEILFEGNYSFTFDISSSSEGDFLWHNFDSSSESDLALQTAFDRMNSADNYTLVLNSVIYFGIVAPAPPSTGTLGSGPYFVPVYDLFSDEDVEPTFCINSTGFGVLWDGSNENITISAFYTSSLVAIGKNNFMQISDTESFGVFYTNHKFSNEYQYLVELDNQSFTLPYNKDTGFDVLCLCAQEMGAPPLDKVSGIGDINNPNQNFLCAISARNDGIRDVLEPLVYEYTGLEKDLFPLMAAQVLNEIGTSAFALSSMGFICCTTSGLHSFRITKIPIEVKSLEETFLPSSIISDWTENEPEALSYIQNRPFYSKYVPNEKLFQGLATKQSTNKNFYVYTIDSTLALDSASLLPYRWAIRGDQYSGVWDLKIISSDINIIGHLDNVYSNIELNIEAETTIPEKEPIIVSEQSIVSLIDFGDNIHVTVYSLSEMIKPLDSKFLPTDLEPLFSRTSSDANKVLSVDSSGNILWKEQETELPTFNSGNQGQVLAVNSSGALAWTEPVTELPAVTSSNAGSFLRVDANGAWVVEAIAIAEEEYV